MEVTISGVKKAPRWDLLELLIRDMLEDNTAILTGLRRRDNGVAYQGLGVYDVTVRCFNDETALVLTVTA